MRLLHLTDTHLGLVRPVHRPVDPGIRSDLLQLDAERAFREALAPALQGEVDAVVHTGDLFDRSQPPRRAVLAAAEWLGQVARRVPVVVMAGNHDRRGLARYLPLAMPTLHVVDRPTRLRIGLRSGELELGVVPFERTAAGFSAAARVATGPGVDVLLAHQAFDGHRVPTSFTVGAGGEPEPSRWFTFRTGAQVDTIGAEHIPPGVRWVMCGHLHPRQVVQVGEATVVCPGSTVRTSFSERAGAKGVAIWSFEGAVGWQFRDLRECRPMRVVRGPADLQAVGPGDLVRLMGTAVPPSAVLGRGGWLSGARLPAAAATVMPEPPVPPVSQLSLL